MKKVFAVLSVILCACSFEPQEGEWSSRLATYATSGAGGGTSGTGDRSVNLTPGPGSLIVAFASVSGNSQTAPTLADNMSGTYTLVGQAYWGGTNNMFAFVRNEFITADYFSTTLYLDTDTNTAGELVAIAYSGMERTGASAVKQITLQASQASATTPSLTFSSNVLTDNPTLVAVASADTTTTPPTGWTERRDVSQTTPTTALEVATRNSGFTGTSVVFGASQSSTYAAMGIELDTSSIITPPTPDAGIDASPDAPAPDAPPADAAPDSGGGGGGGTVTVGEHGILVQLYGHGSNPATITKNTQTSGSTFVLAMGGMSSDCDTAPSDNKGNTYTKLGRYDYIDWSGYGSCVWYVKNGTGGTNHTFSHFVTAWDERTMVMVELLNAGTNPTITHTFVQQGNSGAYSPGSGTVSKAATPLTVGSAAGILDLWWGSGPVGYGNHSASSSTGSIIESYGIDHPNGYVQNFTNFSTMSSAGTHSSTWTWSPKQGAQLWKIGIQP